jgi:hypothetical protein
MEVFALYAFLCYAFTLGTYIEHSQKHKNYSITATEFTLMLLAPIVVPVFIGIEWEEKNNK